MKNAKWLGLCFTAIACALVAGCAAKEKPHVPGATEALMTPEARAEQWLREYDYEMLRICPDPEFIYMSAVAGAKTNALDAVTVAQKHLENLVKAYVESRGFENVRGGSFPSANVSLINVEAPSEELFLEAFGFPTRQLWVRCRFDFTNDVVRKIDYSKGWFASDDLADVYISGRNWLVLPELGGTKLEHLKIRMLPDKPDFVCDEEEGSDTYLAKLEEWEEWQPPAKINISGLAGTSIKRLSFECYGFYPTDVLREIECETLEVRFCGLDSLDFVDGLKLSHLDVSGTNIKSLEPIRTMAALESLDIAFCEDVTNLSPLAHLGLTGLHIGRTSITNIPAEICNKDAYMSLIAYDTEISVLPELAGYKFSGLWLEDTLI